MAAVPQAISALRAKLSKADDDQGILINGQPNLTPDDSNSITFPRTASQVRHRDIPSQAACLFPGTASAMMLTTTLRGREVVRKPCMVPRLCTFE